MDVPGRLEGRAVVALAARAGAELDLAAGLPAGRPCEVALVRLGAAAFRVAAAAFLTFLTGAVFLATVFLTFAFADGFFAAI